MSIFGTILSKIFGTEAQAQPTGTPTASPPPSSSSTAPTVGSAPSAGTAPHVGTAPSSVTPVRSGTPTSQADVAAILTKMEGSQSQRLDWRHSIVDLMKLLGLDSSLTARKELAKELHYTGDTSDSAAMNMWLHKQVMQKLAENGGKVPEELRT
jgi:hypothetical protein